MCNWHQKVYGVFMVIFVYKSDQLLIYITVSFRPLLTVPVKAFRKLNFWLHASNFISTRVDTGGWLPWNKAVNPKCHPSTELVVRIKAADVCPHWFQSSGVIIAPLLLMPLFWPLFCFFENRWPINQSSQRLFGPVKVYLKPNKVQAIRDQSTAPHRFWGWKPRRAWLPVTTRSLDCSRKYYSIHVLEFCDWNFGKGGSSSHLW